MADMPLLQASLVNRLIQQEAPNTMVGAEYRQEMQKALTVYLHYAQTMATQVAAKRRAKQCTQPDLKEALLEIGLGELVDAMEKDQLEAQDHPDDHIRPPSPPSHHNTKAVKQESGDDDLQDLREQVEYLEQQARE